MHRLICIGAVALAGCGGGGDSGAPAASNAPASVNVAAAFQSFLGTSRSYALKGTTNTGVALTATLSVSPPTVLTIRIGGTTYSPADLNLFVFSSGQLVGSVVNSFLNDLGSVNFAYDFGADGSCVVRSALAALPTSASAGSSGFYISGQDYPNCTSTTLPTTATVPIGAVTIDWAYSVAGAYPAVCINSVTTSAAGTATQSICAEVTDAAGTLGTRALFSQTDTTGATLTLAN